MAIQSIGSGKIGASVQATSVQQKPVDQQKPTEKPFIETLKESLAQVNNLQKDAGTAVNDLTTGKNQEIHQTMIAIEKADVSFQMMMQVRNKILSAYEEISRMQI